MRFEKLSSPGRSKQRIAILGMGYVGLVTAATFLKLGHRVICVDVLKERVKMVNNGRSPIFELGLEEALNEGINSGDLMATTDSIVAARCSDFIFICVGTPSRPDGSIDLRFIRKAAKDLGKALRGHKGYPVIVVKSTVIPSTCEKVIRPLLEKASGLKAGRRFGLACNPEFLKEGVALKDSLRPDRIVIGGIDDKSREAVLKLYKGIKAPVILTDLTTAEMIKYASNAFLATRVGLSNEVANICSAHGVDVYDVMKGVGLDRRIGPHFLRAGAGFGGSCFPKDLKALRMAAKTAKVPSHILHAVLEHNEVQPLQTVDLLKTVLKTLRGRNIALLGLSFKPDTDDVRETRALPIALALAQEGAIVRLYDANKAALDGFMKLLGSGSKSKRFVRCNSIKDALTGCDGAIIQTESKEFKALQPKDIKRWMRRPILIDGRRTFDPEVMARSKILYRGIGWKNR
jgi:UDPglucose 6-dehydrogenase